MDPRRERAHPAGPRPAHAGGGRGGRAVARHDEPHLGGEDSPLSPVQRRACV